MCRLFIPIAIVAAALWFLAGNAAAHPAWGIAVDRQGQVFFSDLKTVWRVDAQGNLSVFRASADGRHTHDLNTDETGNLYGVDNSYEPSTKRFISAVWKMTPAGDFSYLLAPTDEPPKGTSAWRDRGGNTYHVTEYPESELLVLKRTPSGVVSALVGSSSAVNDYRQGVPYSMGGLAFGTDDALYFVHGANVSKLTMSGVLTPLIRNLAIEKASGISDNGNSQTQLFGIAVDRQANVFVADYGNQRVLKITPDGKHSTVIRAEQSWFPTGVAVKDNELYILEYGHTPTHSPIGTRVRKLSADGKITVLATVGDNINTPARTVPVTSNIEPASATENFATYLLIGLFASLFALSFVIWRIRKK